MSRELLIFAVVGQHYINVDEISHVQYCKGYEPAVKGWYEMSMKNGGMFTVTEDEFGKFLETYKHLFGAGLSGGWMAGKGK